MHPEIFSIGPVTVYSFGVMLAIAFLASGNVVQRELGRKGLDPELASTFTLWAAVGGIVGSRLLYVLVHYRDFMEAPLTALRVWEGGMMYFGGLLSGMVVGSIVAVASRKSGNQRSFWASLRHTGVAQW